MPKVLRGVLDDYIVWKRQNNIPADFLFGGKEPIPETSLRRAFNKYMSTSKKRITPHGFRHSYVSMLIHIGCTTKTVAELIGDTEEQVIKTYSHLYRMDKHIAIAMLNNLVEKSNCTKICTKIFKICCYSFLKLQLRAFFPGRGVSKILINERKPPE
jgi:integrase